MCGRFTNRLTWEEIVRLYRLKIQAPRHNLPPRYNICPTDPVDVVTERDGNRDLVRMRWGLVPSWWPKPVKELKAATFNARAETVAENRSFGMASDEPAASSLHRDITSGKIPRPASSLGTSPAPMAIR
jgi:putative SOS response-associated peptidase YedK